MNRNDKIITRSKEKNDFQPIRTACDWFGGVTAFANAINVAPSIVTRWATRVQAVPIIRCVEIEELTAGMVTRKQLRPDDWHLIWPELRDKNQ